MRVEDLARCRFIAAVELDGTRKGENALRKSGLTCAAQICVSEDTHTMGVLLLGIP